MLNAVKHRSDTPAGQTDDPIRVCRHLAETAPDDLDYCRRYTGVGLGYDLVCPQCRSHVPAGVQMIVLLALNDEGAPIYDHQNAGEMARMGIPVFACTPDLFPDLMAAAINRQDLNQWAAARGIVTAPARSDRI